MTNHTKAKFISYLRVSTQRQGASGLGLEAQRESVARYLNGGSWTLVQEVVEIESGRKNSRPELARALSLCRLHRATLVVSKLDRLARSVAFISTLMESGVKFVVAEMPMMNDLTAHILSATAQYEAQQISARTTVALAAAKARGTVLGGRRWNSATVGVQGRVEALKARRESAARYKADVLPVVQAKHKALGTLRAIAAALNVDGVPAPRGGEWSAVQVMRILKHA